MLGHRLLVGSSIVQVVALACIRLHLTYVVGHQVAMTRKYIPRDDPHKDSQWRDELEVETRGTTGLDEQQGRQPPQVPGLTILFHPDSTRVGERIALPELSSRRKVELSRVQPEFFAPHSAAGRPLVDSHLSRTPIHLIGLADGRVAVERSEHRGEIHLDGTSLEGRHELSRQDLVRGVALLLAQHVLLWLHWLDPVSAESPDFDLVGESPAMSSLRQEIQRAARLDVTVLLRGASGTGKELVARAVHEASGRRLHPYVSLNMAAIPPSLAASELFGAAKGAFTGATSRKGFFERAEGGSLFLDEIGETPPEIQALLLRCLESHEIQPVGAVATRTVDVRVIAATDADLGKSIEEGRFRLPLLHRLAGYEIYLPPLHQRRDDIPRLLVHFLRQESAQLGAEGRALLESPGWLSAERMLEWVRHDWPGNVRELRNVARRTALHGYHGVDLSPSTEPSVGPPEPLAGLPEPLAEPPKPPEPSIEAERRRYRKPAEIGEDELLETLEAQRWQLKPTAEVLGVSRASLYLMIEGCSKIRKAVDLGKEEILEAQSESAGDLEAAAQLLRVSEQGLKRRMTALGLR